jgi:HlyD family secretion protein
MKRIGYKTWGFAAMAALLAVALWWWSYFRPKPLVGFVSSNGRLEAREVDIATKFQGRIAEVLADEGDPVREGQILARMDTKALEAQLKEAEAQVDQARQERDYAAAIVEQRKSECILTEKQYKRSLSIYERDPGAISIEQLDRDQAAFRSAKALCTAAEADLAKTKATIEANVAETERLRTNIDEGTLRAPRSGRVLYRLAEPGEVLPAGGKILTIIDLNDVYMTLFLPEEEAGKVEIGADARILLDALPHRPIPAKVTFVAPKAQFTPKEVETKTEREKLVFRIKVQVLEGDSPVLKPGMPGIAYIRIDPSAVWPERLG